MKDRIAEIEARVKKFSTQAARQSETPWYLFDLLNLLDEVKRLDTLVEALDGSKIRNMEQIAKLYERIEKKNVRLEKLEAVREAAKFLLKRTIETTKLSQPREQLEEALAACEEKDE